MLKNGTKTASALVISLVLYFAVICAASEKAGAPLGKAHAELWGTHPFSMLKMTVCAILIGIAVTQVITYVLQASAQRKKASVLHGKPSGPEDSRRISEEAVRKEMNPHRRGYILADKPNASHRIFGRYDGKKISSEIRSDFLKDTRSAENILIFGSEKMRLLSGVILPMIQRAVDFRNDIFVTDTEDGTVFTEVYPQLKAAVSRNFVFDAQKEDSARGQNLLRISEPGDLKYLARALAKGYGLKSRAEEAVESILHVCFLRTKELIAGASFADAYDLLDGTFTPKDKISFDASYVNYRIRPEKSAAEYLQDNWKDLYGFALDILKAYADEKSLNTGTVIEDFFASVPKGNLIRRMKAFWFRPFRKDSDLWPVNAYIPYVFTSYGLRTGSIPGLQGANVPLSLFIAGDRPHTDSVLYERLLIKSMDSDYVDAVLSVGSAKNISDWQAGNSAADILMLTGTPDEETALFLSEKAGYHEPVPGITGGEWAGVEKLRSVMKDEVWVIGTPHHPSWTDNAGAYLFRKLYHKDRKGSDDMILDISSGKVSRLTLDDYDPALEDKYEAVAKEAAGRIEKKEN